MERMTKVRLRGRWGQIGNEEHERNTLMPAPRRPLPCCFRRRRQPGPMSTPGALLGSILFLLPLLPALYRCNTTATPPSPPGASQDPPNLPGRPPYHHHVACTGSHLSHPCCYQLRPIHAMHTSAAGPLVPMTAPGLLLPKPSHGCRPLFLPRLPYGYSSPPNSRQGPALTPRRRCPAAPPPCAPPGSPGTAETAWPAWPPCCSPAGSARTGSCWGARRRRGRTQRARRRPQRPGRGGGRARVGTCDRW